MGDGTVIIESGSGIGFLVNVPANSHLYKNLEGEDVKVYTHMIVREDDMSLYGFSHKDELELFKLLITVNGVGAKAAMAIMSILPQEELRRAVATGDSKAISAANGIGKKTSERIILELKDKVGEFVTEESINRIQLKDVQDFYKKYYSFKRDLSFGIIIHFVFLYYFPATLVGSTLLFFFKRQLMLIPHLSLILYILYIGNYRPYRTLLILFSISIGYLLLWFSLKYIFTRKLNNQLPHSH